MEKAEAYLFNKLVLIHAMSQTEAGFWIIEEPYVKLEVDQTDEELGNGLLLALEGSRKNVPVPDPKKKLFDPILKLAGVRSYQALARQAVLVGVERVGDVICFSPTKNLGPSHGYQDLNAKRFAVEKSALSRLGIHLRKALSLSE